MEKESHGNLIHIGQILFKCDRGKQCELKYRDDRTGFKRDKKMITYYMSYKRQEILECHDS